MLPAPIAPTTSLGTVPLNPPSNKLAALAGLLAGLRQGVSGIQQQHAADALRQQALAQQGTQNDFERQRLALEAQNAASENLARQQAQTDRVASNQRERTGTALNDLKTSPIGTAIAPGYGDAAFGRGNPLNLDPALMQAIQGNVQDTVSRAAPLTPQAQTSDVAGVSGDALGPTYALSPLAHAYSWLGTAGQQEQASKDKFAADAVAKTQGARTQYDQLVGHAKAELYGAPFTPTSILKYQQTIGSIDPSLIRTAGITPQADQAVEEWMKLYNANATRSERVTPLEQSFTDQNPDGSNNFTLVPAKPGATIKKPPSSTVEGNQAKAQNAAGALSFLKGQNEATVAAQAAPFVMSLLKPPASRTDKILSVLDTPPTDAAKQYVAMVRQFGAAIGDKDPLVTYNTYFAGTTPAEIAQKSAARDAKLRTLMLAAQPAQPKTLDELMQAQQGQ